MRSLQSRLWVLWLLTLLTSAGVAALLWQLYLASSTAQVQRAEAVVARACSAVGDQFAFYMAGATAPLPPRQALGRDLVPVLEAALARLPGVEGGIWSATEGSLAYAYPTYEGSGPKTDLPAAEASLIETAVADAATAEQLVLRRVVLRSQVLLLAACPLPVAAGSLTAWIMERVPRLQGLDSFGAGVALLGGLVLLIAGGVTWLTISWGRQVGRIEAALRTHDIEAMPTLPPVGERELDRIVAALNEAAERTRAARRRAAELSAQVAAAEHLAALGRVAAGLAHEIRNPMASMRLRAENALAGGADRLRPALEASLEQIGRVDRLLGEMLAMTQRRAPERARVDVPAFLADLLAAQQEREAAAGVSLALDASPGTATFDPELIARALTNLLLNALQHTPKGGRIALAARFDGPWLRLCVTDTGPGVDPALRDRLFEPFATGRADGTGLGLAIAREMAEAHGGRLRLDPDARGTAFVLDLPRE